MLALARVFPSPSDPVTQAQSPETAPDMAPFHWAADRDVEKANMISALLPSVGASVVSRTSCDDLCWRLKLPNRPCVLLFALQSTALSRCCLVFNISRTASCICMLSCSCTLIGPWHTAWPALLHRRTSAVCDEQGATRRQTTSSVSVLRPCIARGRTRELLRHCHLQPTLTDARMKMYIRTYCTRLPSLRGSACMQALGRKLASFTSWRRLRRRQARCVGVS
jgi:hypothetical protein